MSAQEQISRLQGLLDRIKRNAAGPRTGATRPTTSAPLAAPLPFAVPAPAPYAAPAPVPHAPPAPAYAAPAPAPVDASVDDLLAGAPELSPPPVEVDVSLDTIPPAAEAEADAPDADPIPLVSAPNAYNVPPLEDPFNLESEVSEVRVTTGEREFGTEVTVAAIEAEAEPIAPEELSEDDLVEVLDVTAMPPPVTSDVDVDIDFEDEQPPASSQRSRVASSMDEALAAAAAQLDAEREVPLKTPPPESGPQESPMPSAFSAPAAPDVDSLLGHELDIPTHAHAPAVQAGPTTEQLGQTIDLEEARGPSLELAEPQSAPPASGRLEELEVALPPRDANGGYDDDLQPPPEARDDLEAHRRSLADAASSPEVVTRAVPVGSPETFASARDSFKPSSFLELLDASLSLYGE